MQQHLLSNALRIAVCSMEVWRLTRYERADVEAKMHRGREAHYRYIDVEA